MPWFHCPNCGDWHYTEQVLDAPPPEVIEKLSPVAFAILANANRLPVSFRRGAQPVALRVLADLVGYQSHSHVRAGMLELSQAGFVKSVPYGKKHRYVGTGRLLSYSAAA